MKKEKRKQIKNEEEKITNQMETFSEHVVLRTKWA
jgi:hypothetical protein